MKIEFCGAFNGTVAVRKGETTEQALERVESVLQAALDAHCKRLECSIGVDHHDYKEAA